MEQISELINSNLVDVLALIIFSAITILVFAFGKRYNQPWLIAQCVPLASISAYYAAAIMESNQYFMRTGVLRTALILFGLTYIAHLTRLDLRSIKQRILRRPHE